VQLRLRIMLTALACLVGGCQGTQAVLDSATGHDPSGPPRDFELELRQAFLLPEGGVVLHGISPSWTGEASSWIVELRADAVEQVAKPGRSGLEQRVSVRWSDWHRTPEPVQPALVLNRANDDTARASSADPDACTFPGAMRRRAHELHVMRPRESFTPGTTVVIPMNERIRPEGVPGNAPAQVILMNLPEEALGGLPARKRHVEVVFLEEQTPVRPVKLLALPWSAAADGGGALVSVLRMGVDRWTAPGAAQWTEQARRFGREHNCACVTPTGERTPAPICYEARW